MGLRNRLTAAGLAVALLSSSGSLIACDREDRQDVEEGVNQIREGVEEGAEEIEKEVDENVDTDGQDDN